MDHAVAPLAMAGLNHDDPQAEQGEAHRREGNIEVVSMVSPLVSADLLMLSRPPAPTAAPDTIAARRVSRARFRGAGDSRAWPAEAWTRSSVLSAAHLDRSDDHNRIVRPADTHAVRDQQPSPERDLRDRQALRTPARPPTGDPRAYPAYPGPPRGQPCHCPTTSHDDGRVQADVSAGPARLRSFDRQVRTRADDAGRGHCGRPRRHRLSQPCGLPTAALHDLTPGGHSGPGNARTPDTHTGHRTADT
jgi:hypothetical protein